MVVEDVPVRSKRRRVLDLNDKPDSKVHLAEFNIPGAEAILTLGKCVYRYCGCFIDMFPPSDTIFFDPLREYIQDLPASCKQYQTSFQMVGESVEQKQRFIKYVSVSAHCGCFDLMSSSVITGWVMSAIASQVRLVPCANPIFVFLPTPMKL
jgi:hypothetical protein